LLGFGRRYLSRPLDRRQLEDNGTSKKSFTTPESRQYVFLCVKMDHCTSNGEVRNIYSILACKHLGISKRIRKHNIYIEE
jgi:hypothetical protein